MTSYSFIVDHIDSVTDVSSDIETITVTETGSGEVNSAVIRLTSTAGKYMTTAPLVDEFHKFRIRITDDQGSPVTFDKVYEVDNIIPIESSQEGKLAEIELLGLEWHLQRQFFAKQFYFDSAFNVLRDIGDQYNANKASLDPLLEFQNYMLS